MNARGRKLALPSPPRRLALPEAPKGWEADDEMDSLFEGVANMRGLSAAELHAEILGRRYTAAFSRPPSRSAPRPEGGGRSPLTAFHDARLKDLENDMERSPHGESTHAVAHAPEGDDFLFGPPRPDRAEWEHLTELWLDGVRRENRHQDHKPHNTLKRDPGGPAA